MEIIQIDGQYMDDNTEKVIDMFNAYYSEVPDIIDAETLFDIVRSKIDNDEVFFITWGEKNFAISHEAYNNVLNRREVVIQTAYNKDPEMSELVFTLIEQWAAGKDIGTVMMLSVDPIPFAKMYSKYGYKIKVGVFEKKIDEERGD